MASEWADIRHAREAEEKKAEEKKAEEQKKAEEKKAAEEEKAEKKRRITAMLEESEGVAKNIAKVEKKLKADAEEKKAKGWMDVVLGN